MFAKPANLFFSGSMKRNLKKESESSKSTQKKKRKLKLNSGGKRFN